MITNTILLIILSLLFAGGLSYFQYFYKNTNQSNVTKWLAFLRFLGIFGVLMLLINPKIKSSSLEIEKTPLPIIVDNSSSIIDLKANEIAQELHKKLSSNSSLKEKFEIQSYKFDSEMELSNVFDFKGSKTNIEQVAKNLKNNYKSKIFPTILISDGNQTTGNDYVYSFDANNKVYPIVLGDTLTFLDVKIGQLNVNKYAFQKNKFPVEVFLNYSGTKTINATFNISQGNSVLNTQKISFSPSKKSVIVNALISAEKVGLQIFKASIKISEPEKNTKNNVKNFAVEVIDQRSEIAIISAINHPDVGALKRAIETNAQRKVTILKPRDAVNIENYNAVIFYQPTQEFKTVFHNKSNALIVTGLYTDFNFLNQQQNNLSFKMSGQSEDYLPEFNSQFNLFAIENISFEQLPPLQNPYGSITANANSDVLLSSKIRNIATNQPLLVFNQNQGKRSAYLLGENIWKWRLQSHIVNKNYESFDVFIDKIIQFLVTNNSKKSLIVNHESFYNASEAIQITAQYFNKNYEFDEKAQLTATIINKNNNQIKKYDLIKSDNAFKIDLDGLNAGKYSFTLKELNSNATYNGAFEILDFDIEKQFVNPDLEKLKQLAIQTSGKVFMPNQIDLLVDALVKDDNYKAVQKKVVSKTPIINWKWLLAIIISIFSIEWFLRKYNGML